MRFIAKFSYGITCAAAAALAVSGIGVFVFGTPPMTHWVLMAHIAAGPVFALGMVTVALTCGDGCRQDAAGALFWLVLACGLIVILSGVVPMTPLFGTSGERTLYLTHRYVASALAAAFLLHLFVRHRPSAPSDNPSTQKQPSLSK